jgi:CheY-like chemotaxis protein
LLFQLAFAKAGFNKQVTFVRNGAEVLVYLKGDGRYGDRTRFPLPQLLLLDLKMQPVSGFDVLPWVRQQPRFQRLPIVMCSTSGFPPDVDRAYQLGANSFVLKPTNFSELVNTLGHLANFWLTQCRLPGCAPPRSLPGGLSTPSRAPSAAKPLRAPPFG